MAVAVAARGPKYAIEGITKPKLICWKIRPQPNENKAMTGIQYVTDEKGRKVGVLIDLKKHGAIWEDFWDGFVSDTRRKEKSVPYEQYRASRLKRSRPRG